MTAEHEGRDAQGRFAEGNKGGPGNPFARHVAELRKKCAAFLAEGRIGPMLEALYQEALKGDAACARLLLLYGVGKPAAPPCEPDEVDAHEMHAWDRATVPPGYAERWGVVAAPVYNELTRELRPALHEGHCQTIGAGLDRQVELDRRQAARNERRRQKRAEAGAAPRPAVSVEEVSELLRHPTLQELCPDLSRPDAHRREGKRPQTDRAANPPRNGDGSDRR